MRKLKKKIGDVKLCLFVDQLAAHFTPAVLQEYKDLDIAVVRNATYSPWYNCIEDCFSIVKRKYKTARLHALVNREPFDTDKAIRDAFKAVKIENVQRYAAKSMKTLEIELK